jgi:hypothetical protein
LEFSTAAGDVASDIEAYAAQCRLDEVKPLMEELELMAVQLLTLVRGLSLEILRRQAGIIDDGDPRAEP